MTGFVAAVIACFVPLEALANLISLGTLMVFTFVDAGVILLRLVRIEGKSQDATDFKESMEQAETHSDKKQKRVIALLLVFTFSVLGISLFLSNTSSSSSKVPLLSFSVLAIICGSLICKSSDSWRRKPQNSASLIQLSQTDTTFECPFFPIVPLGGVALNTILMGGLPLSSWLLCAAWLALGLVLYFSYGIHHSKIRDQSRSSSSDEDRLLTQYNNYMSTDQ